MLVRYDPALPEFFETEEVAVALSHIAVMLHQARDVVALLGAGISTAAGVQDFRSKGEGLYASGSSARVSSSTSSAPATPTKRLSPQQSRALFSSSVYTSPASRSAHWQHIAALKQQTDDIARRSKELGKPVTATHALLKRLQKMGKLARVYTQNIDGLEGVAGLKYVELPGLTPERKSSKVRKGKRKAVDQDNGDEEWEGDCVQLHGSCWRVRCSACPWVGKWRSKHGKAFAQGKTMDCPACVELAADRARRAKRLTPVRSYLRPALLLYDEQSPASETIADIVYHDLSSSPTFLLVAGTSLRIPGFKTLVKQFAQEVRNNGGIAIFVNREEVGQEWDEVFDYHVLADCDDFVRRLKLDTKLSGLQSLESKGRRPQLASTPAPESAKLFITPSPAPPPQTQVVTPPPTSTPHIRRPSFSGSFPSPARAPLASYRSFTSTSSSSPPPYSDFFAPSSTPATACSSLPPSSPATSAYFAAAAEEEECKWIADSQPEGMLLGLGLESNVGDGGALPDRAVEEGEQGARKRRKLEKRERREKRRARREARESKEE